MIIGIWQGFWIAYIRIPSFIVTLAGMLLFRGLTITMLKGLTLVPFPESFQNISSGFIPDILREFGTNLNFTAILVGIIISILYVVLQLKKRAKQKKNDFPLSPLPLFITQIVSDIVHNGFDQVKLTEIMTKIGYRDIQYKTFYTGSKIFMNHDVSLFILDSQK